MRRTGIPRNSGFFQSALMRRILFLLLFSCFSCCHGQERNSLYEQAIEQIRQKDFVRGVKTYYKSLLLEDLLISSDCRKNDLRPVKGFFLSQREKSPGNPKNYFFLALIYRMVNLMPPAVKLLDELLRHHQNVPILVFVRGEFFLWQEQMQEASAFFGKLEKHPKGKSLYELAKKVQSKRGYDPDAAARCAGLIRKGFRHLDLLERQEAESAFRQVMKEFPENEEAPCALLDLLTELNRLPEAEEILATLKKRGAKSSSLPFMEVRLRFRQKNHREVAKVCGDVLARDPGNDYLRGMLAESLYQEGKWLDAENAFQELLQRDSKNQGFVLRRAACLENQGKAVDALEFLRSASEERGGDTLLLLEVGGIYERMGLYLKARNWYGELAEEKGPFQAAAMEKYEYLRKCLEDPVNFPITQLKANMGKLASEASSGTNSSDQPPPPPPPPPTPSPTPTSTPTPPTTPTPSPQVRPSPSPSPSPSPVPSPSPSPKPPVPKTGTPANDPKDQELLKRLSNLYE